MHYGLLFIMAIAVGYAPVLAAVPLFYFLFPILNKHFGTTSLKDTMIWLVCFLGSIGVLGVLNILYLRK